MPRTLASQAKATLFYFYLTVKHANMVILTHEAGTVEIKLRDTYTLLMPIFML